MHASSVILVGIGRVCEKLFEKTNTYFSQLEFVCCCCFLAWCLLMMHLPTM